MQFVQKYALFTIIQCFYENVQEICKNATFIGKGTPEPLIFLSISIPFHLGAPEVHFPRKIRPFPIKCIHFQKNLPFRASRVPGPRPLQNESPELTLFRGPQRVFH